jgi:hypothetical protein
MQHVYLSPHLDDAIFSCAGLIFQQRQANESVSVITTCAGIPDGDHLSDFARQYHENWGSLSNPVASRRQEDRGILEKWNVQACHLETLDGIYRTADGKFIYPDEVALFSEVLPGEMKSLPQLWKAEIANLGFRAGGTMLYAPLAAGNHVDHQLVRSLAFHLLQEGWRVWFYEEFPHSEDPATIDKALTWFGLKSFQSNTIRIDLPPKINAMKDYTSQIPFMFGNKEQMSLRVKRFAADRAAAIDKMEKLRMRLVGSGGRRERFWRLLLGYHAFAERYWEIS